MTDPVLTAAAAQLKAAATEASAGLIERDTLAELILLVAVAQEHLLIIGPPGTAKSAIARSVATSLGGEYFEYLLGRFTEPNEIFGPVDLQKLKQGIVETDTAGMLPEADIAFLDEIFLGSTAILNTLLGVLNERKFRRGHTTIECPLRVCIAASNGIPADPALAAFADRFMVQTFVEPTQDSMLEDLLAGGWAASNKTLQQGDCMSALEELTIASKDVGLAQVRPVLAQSIRQLRGEGLQLSDRRIVKAQRLIAAATVLAGRDMATVADLWPLIYAVPGQEQQIAAREILASVLADADNATLSNATEAATASPVARARRLVEQAQSLLADGEIESLRVESLLREIDANFGDTRPENIEQVRDQLKAKLAANV